MHNIACSMGSYLPGKAYCSAQPNAREAGNTNTASPPDLSPVMLAASCKAGKIGSHGSLQEHEMMQASQAEQLTLAMV